MRSLAFNRQLLPIIISVWIYIWKPCTIRPHCIVAGHLYGLSRSSLAFPVCVSFLVVFISFHGFPVFIDFGFPVFIDFPVHQLASPYHIFVFWITSNFNLAFGNKESIQASNKKSLNNMTMEKTKIGRYQWSYFKKHK